MSTRNAEKNAAMTDVMKKGIKTSELLVFGLLYGKDYLDEFAALIPTVSNQVAEISRQLHQIDEASGGNQAIYWLGGLYIAYRAALKITANLKEMQAADHAAIEMVSGK